MTAEPQGDDGSPLPGAALGAASGRSAWKDPKRAALGAASLGAVVVAFSFASGRLGLVPLLLALAVGVVVPLGASLGFVPERSAGFAGIERAVGLALLVTSPLGALAFAMPTWADFGVLVASSHLAVTLGLACAALRRLAFRGWTPLDEASLDVGALLLPVGAFFLLASRLGLAPMSFREPIVTFTAAHFHYAGFAAPTVLGAVGRLAHRAGEPTSASYRIGTAAVIAGVPATALGIVAGPAIEKVAATTLAAGMLVASAHGVATALRLRGRPLVPRLLLALAFLGLVVPMGFAVAFALTGSAGRDGNLSHLVPLGTMIRHHGAINALVFAFPALLACVRLGAAPRHLPLGLPVGRFFGGLHIGADYFDRIGASSVAPMREGIVDDLDEHARAGFDPSRVDAEVRAFYERTARFSLEVVPLWSPRFVRAGRVWNRIARAIGQVALPIEPTRGDRVASRIVALDPMRDGRPGARAWIRTYETTGEALYVAAYASTTSGDRRLMNIAFPLPFSALVSVLRFEDGLRREACV